MPEPRIVLTHTSHPGNIGAAARAMKTMQLASLYLVQPKSFPDPQATARATGAEELLADAVVCDSLLEAVADCEFVVGLTSRSRARSLPVFTPRQLPQFVREQRSEHSVALVFGTERTGLSNQELELCQAVCTIPTNPDFWSLNVAAAVQIVCYEWFTHITDCESPDASNVQASNGPYATTQELEDLYQHYNRVLAQIDFLDMQNPVPLMRRIRHLYGRADLTRTEANMLRGMLKQVEKFCGDI